MSIENDLNNEIAKRMGRLIYGEGMKSPFQDDFKSDDFLKNYLDKLRKKRDGLVQETDGGNNMNMQSMDLAAGYSPLIPPSLQEKYKREADIDKYLKNMERLKKRGIV